MQKFLLQYSGRPSLIPDVLASSLRGFVVRSFREKPLFKWAVPVCYSASAALIAGALWKWGAVEVRGHTGEVFFLTCLGIVWLVISMHLFPWFGLCIADDAIERRNPAALIALLDATTMLCRCRLARRFLIRSHSAPLRRWMCSRSSAHCDAGPNNLRV